MDAPMPVRATRPLLLAGLLGIALLPGQARAADDPPAAAAGTYSSLAFNDESGDLGGYEMEIVPTAAGTTLVLKIADGEVSEVAVAEARLADGKISATFDLSRGRSCRLVADVQDGALVAAFDFGDGVSDTATLERSVGYWDRNAAK